ncbi:MAG: NAD(P)/FAD-dependent oxidoreductase, partial [FCB group bacterium]|nr:NAD(P)/FAD-dependent oxidoreductase [FCB group bacterium]
MDVLFECAVIGGGIGGSAAALRAAQNGMLTLWLLGSNATRKRSRSQWVKHLDNIIGFNEDIIKDQVLKSLERAGQTEAAKIVAQEHYHINNRKIIQNTIARIQNEYSTVNIVKKEATGLRKSESGFAIDTPDCTYKAQAVVLATGVMDEQPAINKINRMGNPEDSPRWIYPFANREQVLYCIRCEGHLTRNDRVAVIGHKDVAAELAMMLRERYGTQVTILTNGVEPEITADRREILDRYGVEVISEKILDILSTGVKQLNGFQFACHPPVEVRFALIAMGLHRVYNDLARQVDARLLDHDRPVEKRHVWINHKGETSVP